MSKIPLISIIVPCFNHGNYILDTIKSVTFNNASLNHEIIIINDGSTDSFTISTLKRLKEEGYHVIHQMNQGLSSARNTGITKANGKYILPLDSDDKLNPSFVIKSISILEKNPKVGVVYGNYEYFGQKKGIEYPSKFDLKKLLTGNYITACSMYRKEVWEEVEGYDEKMKLGWEDWDFWIRIALNNWHFHHLDMISFYYRIRTNSMVRSITANHYKEISLYIFSKKNISNRVLKALKKQERTNYISWYLLWSLRWAVKRFIARLTYS